MKIITDERCTAYALAGHPERPLRISACLEKLRSQKEVRLNWAQPAMATPETLRLAHSQDHIDRVKAAASDFDGDTPRYPDIYEHACRSVGGACDAMESARKGESAFSLLRPPGHHATRERAMGFCYFNSIAIAALQALASTGKRVAVYDFDVHHGNGTEALLLNKPNSLFISIHQYPCYPGTGSKNVGNNCLNYPVAPYTARGEYRHVLDGALEELQKFKPDLIGISAGFDSYARDPLAQETLEAEDFFWLGDSFRKLNVPVFAVLEGGYSLDLPDLLLAFLKGLAG